MNILTKISIIGGLIVFFFTALAGCERIDAGHVGVKVNLYGDGKGVDDVTEVTGWVFYNPISTKIVEFPTFVQHKEYKQVIEEGTVVSDESFVVNSKDGSEFHVSPLLNYSVKREKVPYIFSKYRVSLDQIEEGFLKTADLEVSAASSGGTALFERPAQPSRGGPRWPKGGGCRFWARPAVRQFHRVPWIWHLLQEAPEHAGSAQQERGTQVTSAQRLGRRKRP